jgi:hypothetical protein
MPNISEYESMFFTIFSSHFEEPFCFYQIELEAAQVKEPIWFASEEIELLASHEDFFLISDSTA